ncbi:MAG TPA: flavin reductase family protein [Dongiaceae bacterium]|nr:flavin reductase family protein [Dongiaceae bacterium]
MTELTRANEDTATDRYFYDPARGHGLKADPFKAVVCPRPIGWISTRAANGAANIAPYSFFNAVCDAPPAIAFASDGWKDSVSNIVETREFAFNLVSHALLHKMNETAIRHPRGTDEFLAAAIESAPCRKISVPMVAKSPAVLECKLLNIVELCDIDGQKTEYKLVIGQVVGVHLSKSLLVDGLFRAEAAMPVMRAGYRGEYIQISPDCRFTLERPPGS